MKVLIVGGGIAGLSLAQFLKQDQFQVTLIEKQNHWPTAGFAMGLWKNGLQLFDSKIQNRIIQHSRRGTSLVTADYRGTALRSIDLSRLNQSFGSTVRFIHRPVLHQILRENLSHVDIRLGTTILNTFVNGLSDRLRVEFSDTKIEEFDILVGADGVHSQVRTENFPEVNAFTPRMHFWAFMVPTRCKAKLPAEALEMVGRGKLVGLYPLPNNPCGVFASQVTSRKLSKRSRLEILKHDFSEFGAGVAQIIDSLDESDPIYSDRFLDIHVKRWFTDRLVLIGDAAHAMLPTTGQGASLAIEDAYVLARELHQAREHSIQEAFQRFELSRRARLDKVKSSAKWVVKVLGARQRLVCNLRDKLISLNPSILRENQFRRFITQAI